MERASSSVAIPLLCALSLLTPLPGSAAPQTVASLELSTLAGGAQQAPAIAFDGARHLLVWEEGGAIWGGLLDASGTVVGGRFALASPSVGTEQKTPAVAASATGGFLVVWAERAPATVESPSPDWNIRGAQVSASGVVGSPFEISLVDDGAGTLVPAPGDQLSPAVASAGGEFLVAWQDGRASAAAPDVYGSVFAADGTPLDQGSFPISTDANAQWHPAVASSGTEYLVVWEEAPPGGESDIYAARVSLQSVVEAEFPISDDAGDQLAAAITFSDSGYVVAWNDPAAAGRQVAAVRASSAAVLDPTSIPIGGVDSTAAHALASDGSASLLVYELTGAGVLGARLSPDGAAVEFTIEEPATSTAVPDGQGIAYGGLGRYVAVHVENVDGVSRLAAFLVTTFEPLQVTVTGNGSVASTPPGISCGAACSAELATGTVVTLTATPDPGWLVEGWTGCDAATSCTVTMSGPRTAGATFAPAPPGAPGAPTFGDPTATSVTVSWTAATGAARYELERMEEGATVWSPPIPVSGTTYVDDSLAPATTYQYRVRAFNSADTAGPYSGEGSTTTLPLAPLAPAPPTYSEVGSTSVRISWLAVEGATSYDVHRGDTVDGPWGVTGTAVPGTTLVDATVEPNTTYWYQITATNAGGSGEPSSPASVTTGPGAPGTPTVSDVLADSVTLAWTAPASGAESYVVERASASGADWADVATVAVLSWTDTTVAPDTTYWYRVRAVIGTLRGDPSPAATTTTLPLPPAAPEAPTCGPVGETTVSVSWTAVAGATSYDVERTDATGSVWSSDLSGTTHLDTGLSANTAYSYRVRGSNDGGDGALSPPCSATTLPAAPGAPALSGTTASSVTVSWTAPAGGAETYTVERATGAAADWTAIATGVAATTFSDTTASANVTYRYRVRGANASGAGAPSPELSVTTLPDAPGTPTFGTVTASSLIVSWTAPASGAESYALQRATSETGTFTTVVAGVTALSAPDAGLEAGTVYWYRVVATTSAGTSLPSGAAQIITLPGAPGEPAYTNVATSSVTVGWTPAAGAASYAIERAPDDGANAPGPWQRIAAGVTLTAYDSAGLTPNTKYWYRLIATNASGEGAPSAASNVTTLPGVPGTPTFSGATATSLVVSWAPPAGGATSYELQRASSAGGTFTTVRTVTAPAASATDSGLTIGTTYWYRVRAVNAAGASAYSASSSAPTLPDVPGAITFSNVVASSLRLTWGAAAGATTYKVERAPDSAGVPGTFTQIAAAVAATTYDSTGLTANAKYWFRVRATNVSGDGAYGVAASVTTMPNPPGGPSFTNVAETALTVSWTAPSGGAASYDLERGTSDLGPWTALATATTATTFDDSGLTAGTTYWYRVHATNLEDLTSAWASRSVITLPAAPAAPSFSNVGPYTLDVSWPAVTGASSYVLERAPDDGGGAGTWTVLSDKATSPLAVQGLSANTRYWFRLRAANASGAGAWSPAASVWTLPNAPGKPELSLVTKTSLTVSWTAPAGGAASYELQRAPTANGTWTTLVDGTAALTFDDAGLTAGTTYYYRVRALNAAGGRGVWSPVASTTTIPATPGTPWFTGVSTVSLTVNWDPIPGATIYQVERSPDVSGSPQPDGWVVRATLSGDTYYNDVGTANTVYWYRIRAATDGGFGDYSPEASVATIANAPGKPTFSGVTQTSVTLSWTAPSGGAVTYVVERALAQLGPYAPVATGVATTSWSDTTLTAGTTYWYRIRAANTAGATGAPSTAASVTTVAAPPSGAPGAPTYSAIAATTVAVAWTDTSGATSYRLERAPDAGGVAGTWTEIAVVSARSHTDRYLSANTRYWYRVRGATAGGEGAYSDASSVITAPNAPGTPAVTSVATTSLALTWTEPAGGAASYELERATSASGPWGASMPITGRSHTDAALTPGTSYWYRVRATNASGVPGAYSPTRVATTLASPPGGPTYAGIAATSVTLSWSASEGATRYNVERSIGSSGTWSQVAASLPATSYTTSSLAPNTVYWFRVSAVNSAGAPGPYSPATTVTTAPAAPGAPTFSLLSTTSVTVSWTAPAGGAASYALERAPTATGVWARLASDLASTTFQDASLSASTAYWYRVRAANGAGVEGAPSAARSLTTPADATSPPGGAPGAPTFSHVAASSLRVSWTVTANATSYELERAPAPAGPWTQIAALAGTTFIDTGRTANTTYLYRVRGSNAAGDGPPSPESSIVTAPNPPQGLSATAASATSATLGWAAPAGGAASYEVERAPSALGPWAQVASGIALTTTTDAGLTGNTTYYYRARAANSLGIAGTYSAPASVTTPADGAVALPGTPGTPAFANVTASSLQLSWSAAANATSYKVMRAPSAGGIWAQIASVTTAAFTDAGRSANTFYAYRIVASNGGGDGPASPVGEIMTAPNAPGTPAFTGVGATQVTVGWAAPIGGASSYRIERAPSATGPWIAIASVTTLSHTDAGLTGSATYHYRVRAASSAGTLGRYSAAAAVTTLPDGITATPAAPDAPVYSNVTPSSLRVLWSAVSGATSYELERAIGGATTPATFAVRATGLTTTSYFDTSIAPNTRYWYRVRGVSPGGKGAQSAVSSVLTPPTPPGAPAFSSIGTTALTVSWTAPSGGAASYKVERATASYGPWVVAASTVPTTSFVDSGLLPGTLYYYRVRATNADGVDSAASASRSTITAASGAVPIAGAPGTPTFSSVLATSLTLSWAAGTSATSYAVERATSETGPWTQVATVLTTSYGDSGLSANTRYWYRVVSLNALGPGLASNANAALTDPGQPGAPTFSAVDATTLTVSWTAPAGGATSYQLERSTSETEGWVIVRSGVTSLSFADSGLTAGTTWYYRVKAANADGQLGTQSLTRPVTTAPLSGS